MELALAELDDDEDLSGDHDDAEECLSAEGLHGGVGEVEVQLAEAGQGEHEPEAETNDVKVVVSGHPEEGLEEEGVELLEHEEGHDDVDAEETLQRLRLSPTDAGPGLGSELHEETLDLVAIVRILVDTLPVILEHFQVTAELGAEVDTQTIADEHVEDPLVPPALGEVGEHVLEADLDEFPGD